MTTVLDAWGRPFILQVTACSNWSISSVTGDCARLVSAGFGSGVGLGNGNIDTAITANQVGDDRILYLNAPRPAGDENLNCN